MIKFTLPIIPTAQARAKVTVRGNFATAYKTGRQKDNERTLEACLLQHKINKPMTGPLVLEFVACMPVSRSDSKKTAQAKLCGAILPDKKPDLDNLAKQLKDAMTRLQFWHDDSQIVCLRCKKVYGESGSWSVAVYEAIPKGSEI